MNDWRELFTFRNRAAEGQEHPSYTTRRGTLADGNAGQRGYGEQSRATTSM